MESDFIRSPSLYAARLDAFENADRSMQFRIDRELGRCAADFRNVRYWRDTPGWRNWQTHRT